MAAEVINTRYEIIEQIPTSDTPGVVYKARDTQEDRIVALHVLPTETPNETPNFPALLRAAVWQAARLQYPTILQTFELTESAVGDSLILVTEFMRGITLKERIRRVAPFSLSIAVDIALSVALALEAAHRTGMTHGDLRPQYVLISPEGQLKTAGFQTGLLLDEAYGEANSGAPYRAPEFKRGETVSEMGDVFALGAILYEMLTGTQPTVSADTIPQTPRILNPGIPPALEGTILKALHPDLSVRYKSAAMLLADLQNVRDALKTGRSLTWSPLAEKRVPRPPVDPPLAGIRAADGTAVDPTVASVRASDSSVAAVPAPDAAEAGARASDPAGEVRLSAPVVMATTPAAAPPAVADYEEPEEEEPEREGPSALDVALRVLFVLVVIGVIGLVAYASQFFAVPNDVIVPNLIGKTYDDATRVAQQQNFHLALGGQDFSAKWPEDQIYSQDPPAGRSIKAGKDVTVYKSLGPRLLTVPDLVGMTVERATRALHDANLPVGAVTEQYSDTVGNGVIISQTPVSGSNVARATAVNYVVSKGAATPDLPVNVTTTAIAADQVEIAWQASAHADSYTVTRIVDGTSTVVAQNLKATKFVDTGLTPDTSYAYTVEAVNSIASSGPSDASMVITPSSDGTPANSNGDSTDTGTDSSGTPPDTSTDSSPATPVTPPATDAASDTDSMRARQFTIRFQVPHKPSGMHHVQIEVEDATGKTLVFDEMHPAGDLIAAPIPAFGNKVKFQIYLDEKLVKQQTL